MSQSKAMLLVGSHIGENVKVSHVREFIAGLARGSKLVVVDPRLMDTTLTWIYACRLKKTPIRRHAVKSRDHFEQVYDERFVRDYGFYRPAISLPWPVKRLLTT